MEIKQCIGPFKTSNWVIKDKLIVGGYPYNLIKGKSYISRLRRVGVNVYVNLLSGEELNELESYRSDLKEEEKYYNLSIVNKKIASDEDTISLVDKIITILSKKSNCVYIHCLGGHGRTGVLVSLILSHLFQLDYKKSLSLCQKLHNVRYPDIDLKKILTQEINKHNAKYFSPQTSCQLAQVERLSYSNSRV